MLSANILTLHGCSTSHGSCVTGCHLWLCRWGASPPNLSPKLDPKWLPPVSHVDMPLEGQAVLFSKVLKSSTEDCLIGTEKMCQWYEKYVTLDDGLRGVVFLLPYQQLYLVEIFGTLLVNILMCIQFTIIPLFSPFQHEMIHAYLFVTANNRDRDGHGPEFHKHMYRINGVAGTNITVSMRKTLFITALTTIPYLAPSRKWRSAVLTLYKFLLL